MKAKNLVWKSLLMGLMVLVWGACASDTDLSVGTVDVEDEATVDTDRVITITINSSTNSALYYANTRADDNETTSGTEEEDEEVQTAEEKAIYTLHAYLFTLDENATKESDDSYLYYRHYTITEEDDDTATEVTLAEYDDDFTADTEAGTYIDDGSGKKQCKIYIDTDMLGRTVRILLIANDTPAEDPVVEETTLSGFWSSLASATVSNGDNVDVLVGSPCNDSPTGYPMSATAYVASVDDSGAVTATTEVATNLTVLGVTMSAELVRTMARIDIFNWIPNLTITAVRVESTPNASYLFPQYDTDGTTQAFTEPTTDNTGASTSYITLYPLTEYYTDGEFNAIEYNEYEESDNEDTDLANAKEANTSDRVLYIYEQQPDATSCPTVYISYIVDLTGEDANGDTTGNKYKGTMAVPFSTTDDDGNTEYIAVERNNLYTIQLGENGQNVTGTITATFCVLDWRSETSSTNGTTITITDEMDINNDEEASKDSSNDGSSNDEG